jgi:hypothetical protein
MFRESTESNLNVSTSFNPEVAELKTERIELDEHIFDALVKGEKNMLSEERQLYHVFVDLMLHKKIFEDLERVFSMWVPSGDPKRIEILNDSHEALRQVATLGLKLRRQGVEIPWVNPQVEEQLKKADEEVERIIALGDRGKDIPTPRVDLFRAPEDEKLLKLIAERQALKETLEYKKAKDNSQVVSVSKEQRQSMENILDKFDKLPNDVKNEYERLVNDENYYHEGVDRLKQQLATRLAKQSNYSVAA